MSDKVRAWAWEQDLPTSQKFVLIALAQFADENGSCFPSVATLATMTQLSERSVRDQLDALSKAGLVNKVARVRPGDGSQTSNRYHLYYGPPANLADPPASAAPPPPATVAPLEPKTTRLKRNSYEVSTPSGYTSRPAGDDVDNDPEDVVLSSLTWDHPPTRKKRDARKDTPMGLATEFRDQVMITYRALDAANLGALSGSFKRWIDQGTAPVEIREMIRIYCADNRYKNTTVPHWQAFLNKREEIWARAMKNLENE